tara:strand:- start:301 stop:555 length:255 start_codon:yes stop_codon:yes gene_type:complete
MKELNMSWSEIKATPTVELQGLLKAFDNYSQYHAFDGYSDKDINQMAKDKPEVRNQYQKTQKTKDKFDIRMGRKKRVTSFRQLM